MLPGGHILLSMTEFYVKVRPGSDKFDVERGHILKVGLTQEAEHGRANAELVEKLSNIIGEEIGIVKGHKSRRKKVKLEASKDEVERRIEEWQRQR